MFYGGGHCVMPAKDVVLILDYDMVQASPQTMGYLEAAKKRGAVTCIDVDNIHSMIIAHIPGESEDRIFLSPIHAVTLKTRLETYQY